MHYLIDGYNFLFQTIKSSSHIEKQRSFIISFLNKKCKTIKPSPTVIFDGHNTDKQDQSRCYFKNLKVIFTHENQTADEYIIEKLSFNKNNSNITVVTSDKKLALHSKSLKAKTKTIADFLKFLDKKQPKTNPLEKEEFEETKQNMERLRKIFEKKLNKQSENP